jgi:hypothetical protein
VQIDSRRSTGSASNDIVDNRTSSVTIGLVVA